MAKKKRRTRNRKNSSRVYVVSADDGTIIRRGGKPFFTKKREALTKAKYLNTFFKEHGRWRVKTRKITGI